MGISRARRYKRRATGGMMSVHQKKRKFELARAPAATKLGAERVRPVRCRGGNMKFRALKLDQGNFVLKSLSLATKARILDVIWNATSNELVRTKTLVKHCIVTIDCSPIREMIKNKYGLDLHGSVTELPAASKRAIERRGKFYLEPKVLAAFLSGKCYAKITSRPGQSGRIDGELLEGEELAFYIRKLKTKKR